MKTILGIAVILLTLSAAGCNKTANQSTGNRSQTDMSGQMTHSAMSHTHSNMQEGTMTSTQSTNLICPVSGDIIPSGEGVKYVHKGLEFTLCCTACIADIQKNFDKYKKYGKPVN